VQRQLAALPELAIHDPQELMAVIDVVATEADRLPDPHPGDGHQPDQRLHRRAMQLTAETLRGEHQILDLL
jgi:hypothetical protein